MDWVVERWLDTFVPVALALGLLMLSLIWTTTSVLHTLLATQWSRTERRLRLPRRQPALP